MFDGTKRGLQISAGHHLKRQEYHGSILKNLIIKHVTTFTGLKTTVLVILSTLLFMLISRSMPKSI